MPKKFLILGKEIEAIQFKSAEAGDEIVKWVKEVDPSAEASLKGCFDHTGYGALNPEVEIKQTDVFSVAKPYSWVVKSRECKNFFVFSESDFRYFCMIFGWHWLSNSDLKQLVAFDKNYDWRVKPSFDD